MLALFVFFAQDGKEVVDLKNVHLLKLCDSCFLDFLQFSIYNAYIIDAATI